MFAPNTYQFSHGTTDLEILRRLYQDQIKILNKAWESRDETLPYQTPYDALIMASIIEKETGVKQERQMVSAVFVNRLRQGMRLQTDPTIIYGMFDRYDGKIYRSNIAEKQIIIPIKLMVCHQRPSHYLRQLPSKQPCTLLIPM